MKRLTGFILTLGSLFGSQALYANLVDIDVIDRDSGREMPLFYANGKTYIAGEPGHRYSISLNNRTDERVLAVLSVDGVNAVTGESAEVMQSGYVLSAYGSADINGWRKNLDEVAQFVFSAPGKSYAARTGRPQNVGVIGVAVYREAAPIRQRKHRHESSFDRFGSSSADSPRRGLGESAEESKSDHEATPTSVAPDNSFAEALSEKSEKLAGGIHQRHKKTGQHSELGTGHGAREWSQVGTTEFRRASSVPDEIIELQYDTYAHLAERGVVPHRDRFHDREPRAFAQGFVPDPY